MGRGKKSRGSMTYQAVGALQTIHVMGVSPQELAEQGLLDKRIWTIRTMRLYCRECSKFAKWCKERYGVRNVTRVTPAMAAEYLQMLRDQGLDSGTVGVASAALAKFDAALRERGDWSPSDPPLVANGRRPDPAELVYTPGQAARIIEDMAQHASDKQTALVVKLQWMAGLTTYEAIRVRGQDIDLDHRVVTANGKKGLIREVQVGSRWQEDLEGLKALAESNRDGYVFQGRQSLVNRTRQAVYQARQRLGLEAANYGTTGFRRLFARDRYHQLRSEGLSDRASRCWIANDLGFDMTNNPAGYVTVNFVPQSV